MITLIIPYYRNQKMLELQLKTWCAYSLQALRHFKFFIVDDGSPEPAEPIVKTFARELPVSLYRISVDIPWNRGGARNLGSQEANTKWIMHTDIDHLLPPESAEKLTWLTSYEGAHRLKETMFYRFRRYRFGRADETRKKDAISPDTEYGEIKPHGDSYLCTKELYWRAGGYDEDYSGCLGGGSPFLQQLESIAKAHVLNNVELQVYTRSACPDASDTTLNRDTSEYVRRKAHKIRTGNTRATNPIRFPWSQVQL